MKTKLLCLGVVLVCATGCELFNCAEVLEAKRQLQDEHFAHGLIGAITEEEESDYQGALNRINSYAEGCERWAQ